MFNILAKVQKLIALADSPVEEESRNAAILAVRLIKQHDLLKQPESNVTSSKKLFKSSRRSREDLKFIAYMQAHTLLRVLGRKAKFDQYPFYSAGKLADRCVARGVIDWSERSAFYHSLTSVLKELVESGCLELVRGKGYKYPMDVQMREVAA